MMLFHENSYFLRLEFEKVCSFFQRNLLTQGHPASGIPLMMQRVAQTGRGIARIHRLKEKRDSIWGLTSAWLRKIEFAISV